MGRLTQRNRKYSSLDTNKMQNKNYDDEKELHDNEYYVPSDIQQPIQQHNLDIQSQQIPYNPPVQHPKYIDDEYGESRSPAKLAGEIERDPSPKGSLEVMIGGRPIDLHQLEDYLVWKTSPYVIKTLMRYHNAKTVEEVKGYALPRFGLSGRKGGGGGGRTLLLILGLAGVAIVGFLILMFMPQILDFFKGFGGF